MVEEQRVINYIEDRHCALCGNVIQYSSFAVRSIGVLDYKLKTKVKEHYFTFPYEVDECFNCYELYYGNEALTKALAGNIR